MQIKTTIRYYFTPVRIAITKNKKQNTENKYQKGSEEIGTMCNVSGDVRIWRKQYKGLSKNLNRKIIQFSSVTQMCPTL